MYIYVHTETLHATKYLNLFNRESQSVTAYIVILYIKIEGRMINWPVHCPECINCKKYTMDIKIYKKAISYITKLSYFL